jgi:hypothetical protein
MKCGAGEQQKWYKEFSFGLNMPKATRYSQEAQAEVISFLRIG